MEKSNGSALAFVNWNSKAERYELMIKAELKAYSQATGEGEGKEAHAEGKAKLIEVAEIKGYTVVLNDGEGGN